MFLECASLAFLTSTRNPKVDQKNKDIKNKNSLAFYLTPYLLPKIRKRILILHMFFKAIFGPEKENVNLKILGLEKIPLEYHIF